MMTATAFKQEAHKLVDQLPDAASWRELIHRAAVRADLEEGLADIKAGRTADGDEVLRWIDSWGADQELNRRSRAGEAALHPACAGRSAALARLHCKRESAGGAARD